MPDGRPDRRRRPRSCAVDSGRRPAATGAAAATRSLQHGSSVEAAGGQSDAGGQGLIGRQLRAFIVLSLRAEDVLTFLGRKLHGGFAGEILNEWKRRWPGARVKHWMKGNWIKMYDKHGCVLRVETVINDPYEFKVRRRAGRRGRANSRVASLAERRGLLAALRHRVGGG